MQSSKGFRAGWLIFACVLLAGSLSSAQSMTFTHPVSAPAATVIYGPTAPPSISPQAASPEVSEGGADVVYIRSQALWNVTNFNGSFSAAVQTNFTNALRTLLANESFMSIALTRVQQLTSTSYMVASSLVVGEPIVEASQSFEQVAYLSIMTQTLGPDFQRLLAAQGINCNVNLHELAGQVESDTSAVPLVNIVTNVTLTGVNINQLLQQALTPTGNSSVLTPLQQQLRVEPYQTLNITPVAVTGNTTLGLTVNTTFDQANLPDYWSLLFNYSNYSPPVNGQQLNFTLDGDSQVTQAGTRNQSAAAPGLAPAPSKAQSDSTSTAINIAIYMSGGGITPFTTQKQNDATAALAGVFSILIGTGSVALRSYQPANGPTTSSVSGARRRLLQSGIDTTFAATIPSATSNSLLVLQSQSPQVRSQFGGWFQSQMQARGYNGITVQVENVTSTGAAAPASGPAGTTAVAAAAAPPSGHGTNVGAIVGGVVGGVVGLALILGLLAFFIWREARRQRAKAVNRALVAAKLDDSSSSEGRSNSGDVKEAMRGVTLDRLLIAGSDMSTPSRSDTASATSRDEVKSLLVRSNHRRVSTRVASHHHNFENEAALIAIARLAPGTRFQGLYQMDTGGSRGANSLVCFAHTVEGSSARVAIKFHPDMDRFQHENRFYENRMALEDETAADYIPAFLGSYSAPNSSLSSASSNSSSTVPPCIVLERGEYTLKERVSALSGSPVAETIVTQERVQMLSNLCKAVEYLHARSLVHRAIQPANFLWCPQSNRWKLFDFTTWARTGDVVPLQYSLRYAAPELLAADLAGESTVKAEEAADIWALGLVCFELFRGRPLFGEEIADDHIIAMLLGYLPFPWEADSTFFSQQLPQPVANFVLDLLHRNPACRKPIKTIVHSHVFGSFDFNIASTYSNVSELLSKDY